MNYGNTQNNNQNDTNTRGYQFKNKDGFEPSTLMFGFWNHMISLKMYPALPKDKQTESKTYNYEKVIATAITPEKAITLYKKMESKIFPAIANKTNASTGVIIGKDSLLVVGTGVGITGEVRPYIAIHKSLNEKTKKPEVSMHYEFIRSTSVDDYDESNGAFTVEQDIHAELILFYELLKDSKSALSNSIAHSLRAVNKFYNDRVLNDLAVISSALGITTKRGSYSRNSNSSDVFSTDTNNSNNNHSNDSSTPVEELNNIDEIEQFLS